MDWKIDWAGIFEKLKTENIISYVLNLDIISLVTNPYLMVSIIFVLCLLIFFKFVRTLALLLGTVAIGLALIYSFPEEGQELALWDIAVLGTTCFLAAACWIYVFLIRID
jgi:hypothetical protein